jgi:hypothetical protein
MEHYCNNYTGYAQVDLPGLYRAEGNLMMLYQLQRILSFETGEIIVTYGRLEKYNEKHSMTYFYLPQHSFARMKKSTNICI